MMKSITSLDFDNNTALMVVDMQFGFHNPAWGQRNNPAAEDNVAALLKKWRRFTAPVIHIHHNSPSPLGHFRADTAGHAVLPEARPMGRETIYRKRVNSAFIGTTLEKDLRELGITKLVIVGLTTNHCISTTARMAGNLDFDTYVVADATAAFDRANLDGSICPAEAVHLGALADLSHEFAHIVGTEEVLFAIDTSPANGASGGHD